MKVGNQMFLTPWDDPVGYELDWRMRMARAVVSAKADTFFGWAKCNDQDVRDLVAHLEYRGRHIQPLDIPQKPHDRVCLWDNTLTGTLVQAFLLTPAPYDAIGKHLGLSPAEVVLYGRLFYDVRDNQGNRCPAILMRIKTELRVAEPNEGNKLKLVALAGGATMLCQMIAPSSTEPAATLYDLVDQALTRRVVTGELRDSDLIRLQANGVMRTRMDWEFKPPAKDQGGWDVLQKVLETLKVEVKTPDREPEQQAHTTQQLRSHFDAQRKVSGTPVPVNPETGEGNVDNLIRTAFGKKAR